MRCLGLATLALLAGLITGDSRSPAADPFWGADPAWTLLHEPAVVQELVLTPTQRQQFHGLLDELDAKFFPLRNKPNDEAAKAAAEILAEAASRLEDLLSEPQFRRFTELQTRQQGTTALLRVGMTKLMSYKPQQKERLEKVISETLAATRDLEKRVSDGEPREPLEKEYAELKRDELQKVTGVLTPTQRSLWQRNLGRDFDLTTLGRPNPLRQVRATNPPAARARPVPLSTDTNVMGQILYARQLCAQTKSRVVRAIADSSQDRKMRVSCGRPVQ